MKLLRALAVDDDLPALDELDRAIRLHAAISDSAAAADGGEALQALAARSFDIAFLHVHLPGIDGLELARIVRRFASPPAVVFLSEQEDAAADAFALGALDYLLKPIQCAHVHAALDRIAGRRPKAAAEPAAGDAALAVDVPGGGIRLVARSSVLYLEADGERLRVVSTDGCFLARARIGDIERRWAAHGFHRVHREYLVNLRRTVGLRSQLDGAAVALLSDGSRIPIARRKLALLRRRLRGGPVVPAARGR
jgi:DNA-binding LytR/AlgR family response regulator